MTSAAWLLDEKAKLRLRLMETLLAERFGSRSVARETVAEMVGLPASSLERARRGRAKGVKASVSEAIREAFIWLIEHEMKALEHELGLARDGAEDLAPAAESEAIGSLIAARKFINQRKR